jgi:glycosyltransferase involved in cell wall biosynthesis
MTSTNRILFDCEPTKNIVSGLYQFCLQLGQSLIREIDPGREELTFYVPRGREHLFGEQQRYFMHRPMHKFVLPGTNRFNVWHSAIQNSPYRPASKVKMVLTIHDLNFLIQRKGEPAKIKKYLRQVQRNIDRADHISCISGFTLQTVKDNLQLGGKPANVIYNGCNINEFPGFDQPVYHPQRPFIFALGALVPKKNFHVLPCLLQHNDYELVLAGTVHKEYAEKIWQEATRHNVRSRVVLLDAVSEENKYWYYKHCAAFAFPSLAEGFGLPLVEAMYYGKPAFISTSTSLPEIGGDVVYRFHDFDAAHMQAVFERGMQHYQQTMPFESIRQRALQFNWTDAAKAYLAIYRDLWKR